MNHKIIHVGLSLHYVEKQLCDQWYILIFEWPLDSSPALHVCQHTASIQDLCDQTEDLKTLAHTP